jgi:hypothetical protein
VLILDLTLERGTEVDFVMDIGGGWDVDTTLCDAGALYKKLLVNPVRPPLFLTSF